MAAYPRRPSYGIFVRFRRSRLTLRRGILRVEDALAIAEQLRASRFHDQGDIFVVKEPEGTIVEMPPLVPILPAFETSVTPGATAPASSELASEFAPERAPERAPAALSSGRIEPPSAPVPPVSVARRAVRPPVAGGELASILRMMDQVRRFRQVVERARTVQVRLDLACAAAERALLSHPGIPPAAPSHSKERLVAVRAWTARTVDSFERAGAVLSRRLDIARADVGGDT